MKMPDCQKHIFAASKSVEDWFNRMELAASHARFKEMDSNYTTAIELVIKGGIREDDDKDKKRRGPPTVEQMIKEMNRADTGQGELGLDDIPKKKNEEIIAGLEARLPGLWHDPDTGEVMTVREAMKSRDNWQRAIAYLHQLASTTRKAAKRANWCIAAALELESRLKILDDQAA